MKRQRLILAVLALSVCSAFAEKPPKKESPDGRKEPRREAYPAPSQAWSVATVILGAPETDRIAMSIYPAGGLEGCIEYGTKRTAVQRFPAGTATQLTLTHLAGDTEYTYRLLYRRPGETEFRRGPDYHFHTARAPGSPFVFETQGDSHPERSPKQNDPALYEQTLLAAAKDRPDFYICMGDDFSVDTLREVNKSAVDGVYLKQLPYLGLVAHSSPLFLVNGNHEQAAKCNLDGTPDNVAVWAQNSRNRLFPQPAPDEFYSGNETPVEHIGLLRNYYAWTWGDALFVVIDPYWHSDVAVDNKFGGGDKRRDLWGITLGDEQYRWLKKTLETSAAKFKFVFAHHVNGTGRGGARLAHLYEWGDLQGVRSHRPGWELPIHQLMAKTGVTIFFQGHDHLFARETLDGVTYQTLPDPANPNYTVANAEAYPGAEIFQGTGRVRVSVGPEKVRVEYVASRRPQDSTVEHPDGVVVFSYEIPAE